MVGRTPTLQKNWQKNHNILWKKTKFNKHPVVEEGGHMWENEGREEVGYRDDTVSNKEESQKFWFFIEFAISFGNEKSESLLWTFSD